MGNSIVTRSSEMLAMRLQPVDDARAESREERDRDAESSQDQGHPHQVGRSRGYPAQKRIAYEAQEIRERIDVDNPGHLVRQLILLPHDRRDEEGDLHEAGDNL